MSTGEPVPRASAPPGDDLADAIVAAACRLLEREGVAALTTRRIASEAGTTTMAIYTRFGGKQGVAEAVFVAGFAAFHEALRSGTSETDDPVEDLVSSGLAYRRFAIENPTYYSVMFHRAIPEFEPCAEVAAEAAETFLFLVERVRRCVEVGRMIGDPVVIAHRLWALCHGVVSLELHEMAPPPLTGEAVLDDAARAMIAGHAPRGR